MTTEQTKTVRKLYRNESDVLVAGVISGIADYFEVDPTILRLGFIILLLLTGIIPGVIAYIVAYFIVPKKPASTMPFLTPTPAPTNTTPAKPDMPAQQTAVPTARPVSTPITETPVAPAHTPTLAETEGELKKPEWPTVPANLPTDDGALESLLNDESLGLDDLIDE